MPKEIVAVTLSRHTSSLPWGFTLSGGKDQGLTLKVGCVLDESIAERSGLRARDFIWTIGDKEVFDETHAGCVKLVKNAGDRLVLSVERGDHIVPSFEEIHRAKNGTNQQSKSETENRHRTGKAYFRDAMKGHGCPVRFQHLSQPVASLMLRTFSTILLLRYTMRILLMRWSRLWILTLNILHLVLLVLSRCLNSPVEVLCRAWAGW